MNTQNENEDNVRSSAYNPFPEPQTIPSGWDISAFSSTSESDSATEEDESAES